MSEVRKRKIIDDFIEAVMKPASNSSRFHSSNFPGTTRRIWASGTILTGQSNLATINRTPLSDSSAGLSDPTTSSLSSSTITASEIVDTCRSFAYNTTRIRKVQYGLYYTSYTNGQYTQTGVPSDNPNAHASGVISGTENGGTALAHLSTQYLVDIPSNISNAPRSGDVIDDSKLSSFYDNLRKAADANQNSSSTVDLRVCHSSCHNNCHGSRGRR